jgi:phage virion morphogenesis protein
VAQIQITLDSNDRQITAALRLVAREGADLKPVFRGIGEYLRESTQLRIDAGGPAPDGQAWAELSPATLARKKGPGILRESGQLRDTIGWQLIPDGVAVGSPKVYAAIHQFGGAIHHAAQSRKVRFRLDARGELLTQQAIGVGPKRMRNAGQMLVFAGSRHKRAVERWVSHEEHDVTIPARPFLGVSAEDGQVILEKVKARLRQVIQGAGGK